ncbi:hypothetical protein [Actinoplanes aureus]|uniref:Uncharacterized protein n=1 Tax=Actinoplanes aureus TaxID=2792083 RepID=A0A931FZT8_9ACTN|nr:hypothetical protein [Actinoplanes aureus]MBG0565107.1 hypothetical protein [Actinoplanes aureus]
MSLDAARAVADAVLYEGYLLYPYRASAAKNRSRWQFGVLGPPLASAGEPPEMAMQCLVRPGSGPFAVTVRLRFLQLQTREVRAKRPDGTEEAVAELRVGDATLLSWDEAVEREIMLPNVPVDGAMTFEVTVPGGHDEEPVAEAGRVVRRRWPISARVRATSVPDGDLRRLTVAVANTHPDPVTGRDEAVRHSLLGAHLLLEACNAVFVSVLDPPPDAVAAAARCRQDRCWPVLAGSPGLVLGSPIILYDNPRIAEQSNGELYDSTEIDELLTLRVMTMTDAEKAEARATDPRAAAIVERCDAATAADLDRLHGTRRDPGSGSVVIAGVRIGRDSLVRVRPNRRADAQDLFFAGRVARVTAVVEDVDGGTHVAVVLLDDPAAELHDWYGRYFYFAPDELTPEGSP